MDQHTVCSLSRVRAEQVAPLLARLQEKMSVWDRTREQLEDICTALGMKFDSLREKSKKCYELAAGDHDRVKNALGAQTAVFERTWRAAQNNVDAESCRSVQL